MTKITNGSSSASRVYRPRSEETTPAEETSSEPTRSQGAESTQGTQSTQGAEPTQDTQATPEAAPAVQADYWRDSFTPAVASASETPERVPAGGSMSSTSRGSGETPEPIAQVGGVHGNGGNSDLDYDGGLIDGHGNVYPGGTSREGLTPTSPDNGQPANETVYYVNGIQTTADAQTTSMQGIANTVGADVFGIHNSTAGVVKGIDSDLLQCLTDKSPIAQQYMNAATTSLADTVMQDLEAGKPVHLMAHSQGALITANALERVQGELTDTYGAERAEEMMSTIQVETFGGAAASFPYGPQYVHYVNEDDLVPMMTGLGSIEDPAERQAAAGGDRAAIHFIRDDPRREPGPDLHLNGPLQYNLTAHDFNDGYLSHRLPFEEGLASNADLGSRPSPVRQDGGAPVYHEEAPPSAAEANERRATQAAVDSARALAAVQAAVRSGDLEAARAAAAPMEELARVAQEATVTAEALRADGGDAALEAFSRAMLEQDPLIAPSLFGGSVPASAEELEQAQARVDETQEAWADLEAGVTDTRRAAEQARDQAERAAQLVRLLEQGMSPEMIQEIQDMPPQEAAEAALFIEDMRRIGVRG